MDKRCSNKIACLNALMQLLVIIQHANNLYLYAGASSLCAWLQNTICYNICDVNVPLLMAISAFLLYRNLTPENRKTKLLRRVRTLVVPYLLLNTIYTLFFAAATRVPGFSSVMSTRPFQLSFDTIARGILLHAYNPAAWFLLQLILMTALCPVIHPLLKRRWSAIALLAAAFAINFLPLDFGPFRRESFFHYMIGAYAAVQLRTQAERPIPNAKIAGIGGLLLYELMFTVTKLGVVPIPTVLMRGVYLIAVYVLADALDWTTCKPLLKYPFFDYLTHMLVLGSVRLVLYKLFPTAGFAGVVFIATVGLTILICEGTGAMLLQKMPRLYKVLTGGRNAG